jgi:hypothetical protein
MDPFEDRARSAIAALRTDVIKDYGRYLSTYHSLIRHFSRNTFADDDVFICALACYGWMPTQLKHMPFPVENEFLEFLCYEGASTDPRAMFALAKPFLRQINNSVVGTSKFLHFWRPEIFPIIDSRILREYYNKTWRTNEDDYGLYFRDCHNFLLNSANRSALRSKAATVPSIGLVSDIRFLELALFVSAEKP